MINRIDLSKLRNAEYAQLMQDVLGITEKNYPEAMRVEDSFNALLQATEDMEGIFKLPSGSAITAELENLDLLRANTLRGIQSIVRGHAYSQDADIKNHAQMLDAHLGQFGSSITANSYQGETNSIRNIIADWNTQPGLTAAVKALGLEDWQKALEDANNSFSDKYFARAVELGTNYAESFKAKRLHANLAYYALREEINAFYTITRGSEPYKTVVETINGLLSFYNVVLARRAGSNAGPEAATDHKPVAAFA